MRLSAKRMDQLDAVKRKIRSNPKLWFEPEGDRLGKLLEAILRHQREENQIRHDTVMGERLRNYYM